MNRLNWIAVMGTGCAALALTLGGVTHAAESKGPTVSRNLAKPLKAAQDAMKAQNYSAEVQHLKEAQAAKGEKTPFDEYLINAMLGTAYVGMKDYSSAAPALEAAAHSQYATADQKTAWMRDVVGIYFQQHNYDKTIQAGNEAIAMGAAGTDIYSTIALAQNSKGQYKEAAATIGKLLAKESKPEEKYLLFQWQAYNKANDRADAAKVIDKLVTYYPKPDYWLNALQPLLHSTSGTNDEHLQLEVYRLMFDVGVLKLPQDYATMAQISFNEGYPGETVAVLQKAFDQKIFTDQRDVQRYQHLLQGAMMRATSDKATLDQQAQKAQSAATGDPLVAIGEAYLSYGQPDKAVTLIQQGIMKGGLKHAEEATLLLGIAQLRSHNATQAHRTFDKVASSDNEGYSQLGKLWILHTQSQSHSA